MEYKMWLESEINHYNKRNVDCFGITFFPNNRPEFKCYEYITKKIDSLEVNLFFSENNKGIRYDYKVDYEMRNNIKKLNNFIRCEMKYTDDLKKMWGLMEISRKYANDFRLMEIGNRINKESNEQALRGYFSLRKFENDMDIKGEFCTYSEKKILLSDVANCLSVSGKFWRLINKNAVLIEKYGYFPTMFGFQQCNGEIEQKIYFELSEPDEHLERLRFNNLLMLQDIIQIVNDMSPQIIQSISSFWKYGFFLRGIAFGDENGKNTNIRLYFSEIRRFTE